MLEIAFESSGFVACRCICGSHDIYSHMEGIVLSIRLVWFFETYQVCCSLPDFTFWSILKTTHKVQSVFLNSCVLLRHSGICLLVSTTWFLFFSAILTTWNIMFPSDDTAVHIWRTMGAQISRIFHEWQKYSKLYF